jgi:hypothetical protein
MKGHTYLTIRMGGAFEKLADVSNAQARTRPLVGALLRRLRPPRRRLRSCGAGARPPSYKNVSDRLPTTLLRGVCAVDTRLDGLGKELSINLRRAYITA